MLKKLAIPAIFAVAAALIFLAGLGPVQADTLHATDDSYIDLVLTGENFGGNPNLVVQNLDIGKKGGENWVFVRFDLGTLPDGIGSVDVDKASLRLWVGKVMVDGVLNLHVVTESWDEASLTGDLPPSFDPAFIPVPIASADEGGFVTVDITDLFKDWLDGVANFGIVLRPDVTGVNVQLDSKENSQTSHPLEIEVGLIGPEGPEGPQGEQGPAGPQGPAGAIAGRITVTTLNDVLPNTNKAYIARCPVGKVVVGGGYSGVSPDLSITANTPTPGGVGAERIWQVIVFNSTGFTRFIAVHAVCVNG